MIALWINQIQFRGRTFDLATQNKGCTGIETLGVRPAEFLVLGTFYRADLADVVCYLRNVSCLADVHVAVFGQITLNLRDHGLTGGKVARRQQHQ